MKDLFNSFLKGAAVPSWSSVLNTLGPDHPLLKRFQEAKRRQLLQEKDQLQLRLRQLVSNRAPGRNC